MNFNLATPSIKAPYQNKAADIEAINNLLIQYGIQVDNVIEGARLIQYRCTMPAAINVNKLMKLQPNLAIALNCDTVTIDKVGNQFIIEKPGANNNVRLKEFYNDKFLKADGLKIILGTDIEGHKIYTSLEKQVHMLVAGTTGSGKSMFLHQIIDSLLFKNPYIDILAIDTKKVEFNSYDKIKSFHYISDAVDAVKALKVLVDTMEQRYNTFAAMGVRDIEAARKAGKRINNIVCVIDEFADLIMQKEYTNIIEEYIVKLAQKSRAAGIHLIIATQRPTRDVITGLIKANIPCRVCLNVSSAMESRIVMDAKGGENLLGKGDLLFKGNGSQGEPLRLQACYISEAEMNNIGEVVARQNPKAVTPTYTKADIEAAKANYKPIMSEHEDTIEPEKESFWDKFMKFAKLVNIR